jgi:hypothetical protein
VLVPEDPARQRDRDDRRRDQQMPEQPQRKSMARRELM